MDCNGYDPFDSLTQLCVVSDSQEDILRRCSFAGVPNSVDPSGSSHSQIFHFHPTGIFMASLPERLEQREQITPRDAYQAPPEQSGGHRPMPVNDPSLQDVATVVAGGTEAAFEVVCDVATGVDLGKNPDLGFRLEVQSTQQTAEIEIIGDSRREIEGESGSKRLKSSKEALGTASSVPIVLEKVQIDLDSAESGGESKLVDCNDEVTDGRVSSGDNGERIHRNNEENSAEKGVSGKRGENSHSDPPSDNRDPWRRVLPSTMNGEKEGDATPCGNSEKPTSIMMEILKILGEEESEESEESEEEKKLANMSILEIVSRRGMTFPRPCWWPEEWDFSFK